MVNNMMFLLMRKEQNNVRRKTLVLVKEPNNNGILGKAGIQYAHLTLMKYSYKDSKAQSGANKW